MSMTVRPCYVYQSKCGQVVTVNTLCLLQLYGIEIKGNRVNRKNVHGLFHMKGKLA